MKLKEKIVQRQVSDFEAKAFGTKDNPVEQPQYAAAMNAFTVQAAMNAGWFVAEFDIDNEDPEAVAKIRREIEKRYLVYVGLGDEAKKAEKNS